MSCLLQVLSDNAFRRVERRGLDHPVDLPVFVVVREVCLVVGLEVVDRPLKLLASPGISFTRSNVIGFDLRRVHGV
eukprot:SAG22_NODE_12939_length_424_cov_0.772308_1_plen_76_part_00